MRGGAKVGNLTYLLTLLFNPGDRCYLLLLLTPVIPTAPELGAPGIQKKKRFLIEDEDEND